MASVYSERLLLAPTGAPSIATVPAGKRWVVKCLTAWNPAAASSAVHLWIGGKPVWGVNISAAAPATAAGIMVVAYSGEEVKLTPTGTTTAQISGYEFDELG